MFAESERFESKQALPKGWEGGVFRDCDFIGLPFDGGGPHGVFVDCTFERCGWYWSLFNVATFIGVVFRECEFSGVSFAGCRFVACRFERCRFTNDAFEKPCSFTDNHWLACEFPETPRPPAWR